MSTGSETQINKRNKQRDLSIDFIRSLCAIGIIIFHFYCHTDDSLTKMFYEFANGSFGNTIVNIFFIISGAMLYYNNPKIDCLKNFYYKRFKSIFPMFYLTFIIFYLIFAIRSRDFLYGGNPVKLLLTLFGLDGYFFYLEPNYYQVGEWFLGAIVILYAIYPLLLRIFNKSVILATIIAIVLYSVVFIPNLFKVNIACNLFSCLISFELGMILMKYNQIWKKNVIIFIVSFILSIVIVFVKIDFIHQNIFNHLLALCLFFILSYLGDFIMQNKICRKVFTEISKLSFAIFLLQHIVIRFVLGRYMPINNWIAILCLLGIIAITIALAKVLTLINDQLLKCKPFRKLDKFFLSSKV